MADLISVTNYSGHREKLFKTLQLTGLISMYSDVRRKTFRQIRSDLSISTGNKQALKALFDLANAVYETKITEVAMNKAKQVNQILLVLFLEKVLNDKKDQKAREIAATCIRQIKSATHRDRLIPLLNEPDLQYPYCDQIPRQALNILRAKIGRLDCSGRYGQLSHTLLSPNEEWEKRRTEELRILDTCQCSFYIETNNSIKVWRFHDDDVTTIERWPFIVGRQLRYLFKRHWKQSKQTEWFLTDRDCVYAYKLNPSQQRTIEQTLLNTKHVYLDEDRISGLVGSVAEDIDFIARMCEHNPLLAFALSK